MHACTSKSNVLHDRWVWPVNEFFRVIMLQLGKRAIELFQLRLLTSVPGIAQAPFFRTDRGVGTMLPSMIVTSHDHPYKSQPLCLIGRVPFLKGQKSQGKAQVDFDTASRAGMGKSLHLVFHTAGPNHPFGDDAGGTSRIFTHSIVLSMQQSTRTTWIVL